MSKCKKTNTDAIIRLLREAFNRNEGVYSGIPECCIEGYIEGRTYMNVRNSLSQKEQKKLLKWNYVPCEKCFKKNNVVEIKMNGVSDIGNMLYCLLFMFENSKLKNNRKGVKNEERT